MGERASSKGRYDIGERVLILEPEPEIWQKLATIEDIWMDDPRDSHRIYQVKVDEGRVWRIRGRDLEPVTQRRVA